MALTEPSLPPLESTKCFESGLSHQRASGPRRAAAREQAVHLWTRKGKKGVHDVAPELFACLGSETLRKRVEQRTPPLVTGQQGFVEFGVAPDGVLQPHDGRFA